MLSEKTYLVLKRVSRGGRYRLKPNDLNLKGVTNDPLEILGIVCLPVNLGKGTATMRLDFYVVSNFGLPSDGLLGLSAMKSERMIVIPDSNVVRYQGKSFLAMGSPRSLASSDGEIVPTQTVPTVQDFPAEQGQRTLTNSRSKC